MPWLIFIIFFISINNLSSEEISYCNWKKKIPCLDIKKSSNNTSKFTSQSLKKTILTKERFEKNSSIDIIDELQSLPSINITQSGSKGQQASLFMRGTGSNHVLVTMNGIAINDQSTTQGLHDFGVDFIQTIQKIEIYEGPNSTNFGANAIGGVVNLVTGQDLDDSLNYSFKDSENYNFLLNKNFFSENETVYNLKLGSVKNKSKSARYLGKEKDAMKNLSLNFNHERWQNNLKVSSSTYARETVAEYDGSSSDEENYKGNNKMFVSQLNYDLYHQNSKEKLSLYYNQYDRAYNEKGIIDYYDSIAKGIKFDHIKNSSKFSYGLGSEYRYDEGEFQNNGSYSASTKGHYDNISFYTNYGYNFFKKLTASVFGRYDQNKIVGSNLSKKIDLSQRYKIFNFGISSSEGFRNPTIYELFGTDNYGYSGNRNLKSEKSKSNDLYIDFDISQNFNGSIRGFKSYISDQIEYKSNKYVNNSDNLETKQKGINTNLNFQLKQTSIELSSSILSSKKNDGTYQLRRPKKTYGINIYRELENELIGNYNLNINYNYYGNHYDTHSSTFKTIKMDSTDLINIGVSKKKNKNTFKIKLTNLLNEKYQRPHGYSQDKRKIMFEFKTNY